MVIMALLVKTSAAFIRPEPFGHNRRSITTHHHHTKRNNRIRTTRLSVLESSSSSSGFSDHFDMDELRQRIHQESYPYDKLFSSQHTNNNNNDNDPKKPSEVHIILFQPNTEDEGVHTIEYPKGSGHHIVLAFESKLECDLFAANLKEQHFLNPSPYQIDMTQLEDECHIMGVDVQVIPTEMHIIPPTHRAEVLCHDPELHSKQNFAEYLFHLDDATHHPDESSPPKGILSYPKENVKLENQAWE